MTCVPTNMEITWIENCALIDTRLYDLNPRETRLIKTLLKHNEVSRHDLDHEIGAANSPDVVMRLRRKLEIEIPMVKRTLIDRDGKSTKPGYYSLSIDDKSYLSDFFELESMEDD